MPAHHYSLKIKTSQSVLTRTITALILTPIVIYCIYLGGWPFLTLVLFLLTLAELEFCQLMSQDRFRPTRFFGVGVLWLCLADAKLPSFGLLRNGILLVLLSSLAWQLWHRQGSPLADWALTVTGGLYIGLCGACLISLRDMESGLLWTLTTVPSIALADSGAYLFGRKWGRHKLWPSLSPGKTWEGYLAGIVSSGVGTALLAQVLHLRMDVTSSINALHGLSLGVLIAILAPLGDLAVSMIKRQVGAKDSGKLFPGHGGALDRVDSVLWAAVIGYYYVRLLIN